MKNAALPVQARIPIKLAHAFETNMAVKGRVQAHVVDAATGRVLRTMPWQNNLILDQGMDYYASNTWANLMNYCVAGTGTTPTRDLMDGTASQSGTTVTLSGSTYSFVVGDVGKWIGWAGGQQAKITAHISATQVTVDRSQTVSAATATLYRANQTGLDTEVKRSNSYPSYTYTDSRGASATFATGNVLTLRRTYDFSAETGSVNYTEIGISPVATVASNLFSRILLAGTVTVESGQQLRITYELAITVAGTTRPSVTLTSSTGWPYTYNISSITGNGTAFTVTLSAAHHYVAGGSITIAGAKRQRFTITAASSTGSDFTLTTSASHGLSPGDSIEIEGVSPAGYNGTWTCAAGTTGSTIVVTTTANPGTGTVFGNVRQTEPGTWYDGTWTIASVGATTVVITSAISLAAGADGTAKNNLNAVFYLNHWPIAPLGGSTSAYGAPVSPENPNQWHSNSAVFYFSGQTHSPGTGSGGTGVLDGTYKFEATNNMPMLLTRSSALATPGSFPVGGAVVSTGAVGIAATTGTRLSYTNGNFYRDYTFEWSTAVANSSTIRGFVMSNGQVTGGSVNDVACGWHFDEPQRKDSTNRLRITFRNTWTRVFS